MKDEIFRNMSKHILQVTVGFTLLSLLVYCKQNNKPWQLESPDDQVRVEIGIQKIMSSERPYYSVYRSDAQGYGKHAWLKSNGKND